MIPKIPHSLVLILCLSILILSHAVVPTLALSDPVNDMFDKYGKPVSAESYMDIVTYDVSLSGSVYAGRIVVNGPVPSSISSDTLIEWDFLIDSDRKSATSPWGKLDLLTNGIGVDYMIRVVLRGSQLLGQVVTFSPWASRDLEFRVEGQNVTIRFTSEDIGGSKDFDFVAAVRKYVPWNAPGPEFSAADKAPNADYVNIPEFTDMTPVAAFTLILALMIIRVGLGAHCTARAICSRQT